MPQEVDVVAVRIVLTGVPAAGLVAGQRARDHAFGEIEQEAQLDRFQQLGVVTPTPVRDADPLVTAFQSGDVGDRLLERRLGAVHRRVDVHRLLKFAADRSHVLRTRAVPEPGEQPRDEVRRIVRQLGMGRGGVRVFGRGDAGPTPEHVDVQQRVRAQPVCAVHGHARDLTGGVQARDDVGVVPQDLGVDVCRDAAHGVVGGRLDRDRVRVRLDPEVGAGELGDVWQLRVELLGRQVGQVEVDMITIGPAAAPGADLGVDGPRHHVPGGEVLDGRRVALHEALAVLVAQDPALTASTLGEQDAHLPDARGVELVELHVLQRQPAPEDDAHPVTGQGVRVRGHLEDLAEATGGEHHRLRLEDVHLAGGEFVGDHAGRDAIDDQ